MEDGFKLAFSMKAVIPFDIESVENSESEHAFDFMDTIGSV